VAIVTGAARGIGRAISLAFAEEGAAVCLSDKDDQALREAQNDIPVKKGKVIHAVVDVSKQSDVLKMVAQTRRALGSITILVNSVGIAGPTKPCEDVTVKDWDLVMGVNLKGTFLCCRAVLKDMKRQRYGKIINISSITGKTPLANRIPYATSKMGLIGFSRSLALEVARYHISVNVICPGPVKGERMRNTIKAHAEFCNISFGQVEKTYCSKSPMGIFVQAKDIAAMATFLASVHSDRITGQDINVCAGTIMH